MRNEQKFDLNVYDEQIDEEALEVPDLNVNPFFSRTLSQDQRAIANSPHLHKLSLAAEKYREVANEKSEALNNFFREMGQKEYDARVGGREFSPFKHGKFWQMVEYLDGNQIPQFKDKDETREEYQDRIFNNTPWGTEERELLQSGWDLAINSALLCDIMSERREIGATYLLEHVVGDKDSLFYPSVTPDFQTRVVNDSFWQLILANTGDYGREILEDVLTKYARELDPKQARDNILRWSGSRLSMVEGVSPLAYESGTQECFGGLSKRAIANYGRFLNAAIASPGSRAEEFTMLAKAYNDAVELVDEDDCSYFTEEEQEELHKVPYINSVLKQAS